MAEPITIKVKGDYREVDLEVKRDGEGNRYTDCLLMVSKGDNIILKWESIGAKSCTASSTPNISSWQFAQWVLMSPQEVSD